MNSSWFVYEITSACNADCSFCYNIWKAPDCLCSGEPTLPDTARIFNSMIDSGLVRGVTLTGGEPLLRPDLSEFVKFFNSKDIPVGVATNGFLLDKPLLTRLAGSGVKYFEVTLPAVEELLFQKMTGRNMLRQVRKALLELGAAGIPFTVSMIITALNYEAVQDVAELAAAFGASALNLNRFVPGGRGLEVVETIAPDMKELSAALDGAEKGCRGSGMPVSATIPIEGCLYPRDRWPSLEFTPCHCGLDKWVIGPDYFLRTCEQNPECLGSILENRFEDLIGGSLVQDFRNRNRKGAECTKCSDWNSCGGGCRFL